MTEGTNFVFDPIAGRYDRCNHLFSMGLHGRWRRRLVLAAAPKAEHHVLDVCTGTGDVLFSVLKHSPARNVTGIDISEPMLHLAQEKQIGLCSRKWMRDASIRWQTGDITSACLPEATFDAVTCAFGIRNVTDRKRALERVHHALKPDGRVAFLEFSLPSNLVLRFLYRLYLCRLMPFFGRIVTRDPNALTYLARSIAEWVHRVDFERELREAGFNPIRVEPLTFGIVTIWLAHKPGDQSPYGS